MFRASLALGCVLGAGISVALLVIGLSGKGGKDDRQATTSSSADTRGHALEDWSARPARLTRYPLPGYAVSPEFRRFLLEQVVLYGRAKGMAEPAVAVHALRLRDKVLEMKGFGGKAFFEKTLRLIVDDREYRKAGRPFPILMDTAYGAGFRTQANARQGIRITNAALAGGMTHVDKVLSTLGELGIPLDYRLVTETDREYPLAAVLEDSMQRFHLKRELEWSVNAYCDYLGNQQSWRNSRGEEFSFDDVAQALLDRRISDSPCFGTHWVYAVAKICVRWRRAPGCYKV
jgi:hypothetical protein